MPERWTIAELTERVADALADADAPDSGRVRAVPDERAIRYYTTLGLLDRPTLEGRTAYYGVRHLAQLVAIKRAQATGKTLAEIQRTLPTLDDAALATASGVRLGGPAPRKAARRDFWRTAPAAPSPTPPPAAPIEVRTELELAPGVRISLALTRPLTDADLAALRSAATPLLAEALRRHLITPEPAHDPDRA